MTSITCDRSRINPLSDADKLHLAHADLAARQHLDLDQSTPLLKSLPILRAVLTTFAGQLQEDLLKLTPAVAGELVRLAADALRCVQYSDRAVCQLSFETAETVNGLIERLDREVSK